MSDISIGIGTSGIQAGIARVERVAKDIASADQFNDLDSNVNLAESLIELKTAQNEVKANAKVVEAAIKNQDAIIDILV